MAKKKGLSQLPEDNTIHPDTVITIKGEKPTVEQVTKIVKALTEAGPMAIDTSKAEFTSLENADDKEVLDAFIKNPEMKKQAGALAFEIQKEFTNWFSIPQVVKKFQTETAEAAKKIEMLMLFNYCIGKVEKGKPFFKIDIDHRAQRRLIMEEIAEHEGKILFLREKLGKLD